MIKYLDSAPELADWMEVAVPEGLTVFNFLESHRRRFRISNMLEHASQEVKRGTRVFRIFPISSACLRLVSALLMGNSEGWETGRIYLNMNEIIRRTRRIFRKKLASSSIETELTKPVSYSDTGFIVCLTFSCEG
ncbi:MAG: hypothetical protein GX142_10160 [Chloroflexi bacterium]|nr:hypothetical protein [Chloroflexota bacterium]